MNVSFKFVAWQVGVLKKFWQFQELINYCLIGLGSMVSWFFFQSCDIKKMVILKIEKLFKFTLKKNSYQNFQVFSRKKGM
jgi:hypothetical protein